MKISKSSQINPNKVDLLILIPRMPVFYGLQWISNGPIVIASYLESKGYSVKAIDNNSMYKSYTDEDLLNIIGDVSPTVVGLSVNLLNAFTSYRLVKKIKERFPDLIVVAGGLHTFDKPDEVAQQGFDITFVGETEISLPKFMNLVRENASLLDSGLMRHINFLKQLQSIPGLIINQGHNLLKTGAYEILDDLDQLPIANYELLNLEDFIRTPADHYRLSNFINFQRGCPFKCTFCKAEFMGGKIRNNSPDYIVRTLKYTHEKYGQTHFVLTDSNFTVRSKSEITEFCNKMISSGLANKVNFQIQTSITTSLKDEILILLKEAGLVRVSFGVERFSPEFRQLMSKAGTQEQVHNVLKSIHQHGLKGGINILINFPNETEETLAIESDYLLKAIPYVEHVLVNYLIPVPGTAIYESKTVNPLWYLDEAINSKKTSYYDVALQIFSPGVEFNLFGLPKNVLKAMRKFKERQYIRSISNLHLPFLFGSTLLKIILFIDLTLSRISYFLYYYVSPSIENVLFWPFLKARVNGGKWFLANWYYGDEDHANVGRLSE